MVWTYHNVKELRKKLDKGKEPSQKEIKNLREYIKNKSKVAHLARDNWAEKQLANAEILLHKIQQNNKTPTIQSD